MDAQQLLLQHFEKGLAGGALIWLIAVGVGFGSDPKGFDTKDKLQGNIEKITAYTTAHKAKQPTVPDWKADVEKNLDSDNIPESKEFPSWALHNRPNIVKVFAGVTPDEKPNHEAPIDVKAVTERGKITVSWSENGDNSLIIIDEYEVFRRTGKSGKWETKGTIDGQTFTWDDSDVNPRQNYYYKVTAHAIIDSEHPVVSKAQTRGSMKKLDKDLKDRTSGVTGPHKTPRDLIVIPSFVYEATEAELFEDVDAPNKCDLIVYKYDPDNPKGWTSQRYYRVKERDAIGKKKKVKGRMLDFSAGVLKKAKLVKRDHPTIKGKKKDYCVITVKYKDGTEETFNNFEVQKELEGIWAPK
ncbi:MAG: fibronectin type III domain-containing protein [Planctomycetota bacterium]|nr:fibronectin type III domain-containing protein [Planctomycetota bacterium]